MRNLIPFALLAAFLAGCGGPTQTVTDSEGNKATISQDGAKMTFEGKDGEKVDVVSKDGKTTWKSNEGATMESGGTMTEAELGLPLYPGGKTQEGSSTKVDTPQGSVRTVILTTSDAPDKVVEFYKPKIKEPNTYTGTNDGNINTMLNGKLESGETVLISATREKGSSETTVSIGVTSEKS